MAPQRKSKIKLNISHESGQKIVLNYLELFYLRLLAHNMKEDAIASFLEVNTAQFNTIKRSLKLKFESSDWAQILAKAFQLEFLKKNDFIDDLINDIALSYAQKIFYMCIVAKSCTVKQIRNHLVEFYLECEKRLAAYKMNTLKINLSKRECTYIKCQYEGVDYKNY